MRSEKRVLHLVFLLSLFVIFSAFATATQFDVMEYYAKAGKAKCYSNGQAIMPFSQFRGVQVLPGDIEEIAIMHDIYSYSHIDGSYYDINYKPMANSGEGETVLFISEEYSFRENNNYTVVFTGTNLYYLSIYDDVATLKYDFECPGYEHSCKSVDIKIKNCTIDKYDIIVDFGGMGLEEYSQVNPQRDLSFSFSKEVDPDEFEITDLPVTSRFMQGDEFDYRLMIDREELGYEVKSVTIKLNGCPEKLYPNKLEDSMECSLLHQPEYSNVGEDKVIYQCRPEDYDSGDTRDPEVCSEVRILPPPPEPEPQKLTFLLLKYISRISEKAINMAYLFS